jgi:hypothetical protein
MNSVANHKDHKEFAMKTESSTASTKEVDSRSFQESLRWFMNLDQSAGPRPSFWFFTLVLSRVPSQTIANRPQDIGRLAAKAM